LLSRPYQSLTVKGLQNQTPIFCGLLFKVNIYVLIVLLLVACGLKCWDGWAFFVKKKRWSSIYNIFHHEALRHVQSFSGLIGGIKSPGVQLKIIKYLM